MQAPKAWVAGLVVSLFGFDGVVRSDSQLARWGRRTCTSGRGWYLGPGWARRGRRGAPDGLESPRIVERQPARLPGETVREPVRADAQ